MKNKILLLLIISLSLFGALHAQITRGTQAGEIYVKIGLYLDITGKQHTGIFHSADYGKTLSLHYEGTDQMPVGQMEIGTIIGDAQDGVLYNSTGSELWMSSDYGRNWDNINNFYGNSSYATGFKAGEIYRNLNNNEGTCWKSIDFGYSFDKIRDSVKFGLEVGNKTGVVYGLSKYVSPPFTYLLAYSEDSARSFTYSDLDSAMVYWSPSGQHPEITRGAVEGELYLIAWTMDLHYHIYYSSDSGKNWTKHFESDYCHVFSWGYNFTAGREDGSFYRFRGTFSPDWQHIWLYIDHSSDYGKTFTETYFHELDSTITHVHDYQNIENILNVSPNPMSENATFKISGQDNYENAFINIYDLKGRNLISIPCQGKESIDWNGSDRNGTRLPDGVYFYNLSNGKYSSLSNKLLIQK